MVFDELSFVPSTGLINGNPNPVKSKQAMDAKKNRCSGPAKVV
jgi:hypothetical protein